MAILHKNKIKATLSCIIMHQRLRNGIKFDIDRVVPFEGGEEDLKAGEVGVALPFAVEIDPDKILIGADNIAGIVAQDKV